MSERGSFVTDFIYCEKCLDALKKIFFEEKYLNRYISPNLINNRIIAGKIKGSYPKNELNLTENTLIPYLEEFICCKLRIAVLADTGQRIFYLKPRNKKEIS